MTDSTARTRIVLGLGALLALALACNYPGQAEPVTTPTAAPSGEAGTPSSGEPGASTPGSLATQPAVATTTAPATPTATEPRFPVGEELTIDYLRELEITGSEITIDQELESTFYYRQYIASYLSEGNRIYGLLTVPRSDPPEAGFKAIVFCHGYIPPDVYQTTERYVAYVDYLARNGFVVFKIDYRGNGNSEGRPSGAYFSPGYTIDAIAALKSLQTLDFVDPQGIGMWGHSMAGNLVLRAMLVEPDIKAGVIWAGAVYSYSDLMAYGITDSTYRPLPTPESGEDQPGRSQAIFDAYGRPDPQSDYWQAVSLTENIGYLNAPLQIHHAEDDPVVSIQYSEELAAVLQDHGKRYEFYRYAGGGHNINSPYFDQAMLRTVQFFRDNL